MPEDLTSVSSHFAFGQNWADYAQKIGEEEIAEAERGLLRLLGGESLNGKRFLDIGCGSGLHSLAALRLGCSEIVAVDIDPISVATTQALLDHESPNAKFSVLEKSVFDLNVEAIGEFDVVYSWGVLHHTGDMKRAIRSAASFVKSGGKFTFALYRETWLCGLWKLEKRWYTKASPRAQARARFCYDALFKVRLWLTGRRFQTYIDNYSQDRGMDYYHDVHDWMGGYPYESISPEATEVMMLDIGLYRELAFTRRGWLFGRSPGVFGSGCDEYTYIRR